MSKINQALSNSIEYFVINLEHRKDRLESFSKNISNVGITTFNKIVAKKTIKNGALGCSASHAMALASFLFYSNKKYAIIFEDDFIPTVTKEIWEHKIAALITKFSFDLALLSYTNTKGYRTNLMPDFLAKTLYAQTTSAYLITREFAPTLLSNIYKSQLELEKIYESSDPKKFNEILAIDILWFHSMVGSKTYAFTPMLGEQINSYSDIANEHADYREIYANTKQQN